MFPTCGITKTEFVASAAVDIRWMLCSVNFTNDSIKIDNIDERSKHC